MNNGLGHDLVENLIGIWMKTVPYFLLGCARCTINESNVFLCSTYMYCGSKDMWYYFSNYLFPWYCVMLKPLYSYFAWLYLERFCSTFTWPLYAWIECKYLLTDFARKHGWTLITKYYTRILMFLYFFSIGNVSGTLRMFSKCHGCLQTDVTLRMATWGS